MNRLARKTTEYGKHLRTFHDTPHLVAIISLVIHRPDFSIGGSLAHKTPLSIQASCRGLTNQFSLAVAIEIIDEKLGIVRTGTDVLTQIDAPELGAIQFVAIQDDIARIAIVRIIMGVTWIPFQNQFIFSIAIHIAHAAIVWGIDVTPSIGSDTTFRTVDRHRSIQIRPRLYRLRYFPICRSIHLGFFLIGDDAIGMECRTFGICIVGSLDVMGDNLSVSLHIEAYVLAIGTQHAPADEDTLAGSRQCHHATVEFLHCSNR